MTTKKPLSQKKIDALVKARAKRQENIKARKASGVQSKHEQTKTLHQAIQVIASMLSKDGVSVVLPTPVTEGKECHSPADPMAIGPMDMPLFGCCGTCIKPDCVGIGCIKTGWKDQTSIWSRFTEELQEQTLSQREYFEIKELLTVVRTMYELPMCLE